MLKRGTKVTWSEEAEESFCTLKKRLAKAPILITLFWEKEFEVYVDVSGFCIGLVLSQLDNVGRDHLIYFAS